MFTTGFASFFTGADAVPVLGFDRRPKLVFLDAPTEKLPTASTCDLHLRIPTAHGDCFGAFKDWMELGILGNCGFGTVPIYSVYTSISFLISLYRCLSLLVIDFPTKIFYGHLQKLLQN